MAVEQWAPEWDAGRLPLAARRRRGGRFSAAVVVSALAHALVVGLLLRSVADEVIHIPAGSSGGQTGAVTVTLVALPDATAGGQAQPIPPRATTQLDSMLQKFRSVDPTSGTGRSPRPGGGAEQLFREIAEAQQKARGTEKADSAADSHGAADGYDLWAKIRPCWRPASGIVVTLDVGVDDQGRLAWAPKPVRASRAPPGPSELLAESLAVQAAVRCAPFRDAAPVMGPRTFRIVFAR